MLSSRWNLSIIYLLQMMIFDGTKNVHQAMTPRQERGIEWLSNSKDCHVWNIDNIEPLQRRSKIWSVSLWMLINARRSSWRSMLSFVDFAYAWSRQRIVSDCIRHCKLAERYVSNPMHSQDWQSRRCFSEESLVEQWIDSNEKNWFWEHRHPVFITEIDYTWDRESF